MQGTDGWRIMEVEGISFDASMVRRFMEGRCAGIRFKQFLAPQELQSLLQAIERVGLEYYEGDDKAGGTARKAKLGPNFFRFRNDPDEYFRRAALATRLFEQDILQPVNVLELVRELVAGIFWLPAEIARHDGRPMMGGIIRALPEAPIHCDWMPGEQTMLSFAPSITDQFAWNVYLKMPATGGSTLIYETRDPQAVGAGSRCAEVCPEAGDLVVFRSTFAHAVSASDGERLTLSGFFGQTADRILFWV